MQIASIAVQAVLKLFIMMIIGYIVAKAGVLTKEVSDGCVKVLVQIITPAMVFSSFLREYDPSLVTGMLQSAALGILYYIIGIGAGVVLVKKGSKDWEVQRICMLYQNIGFFGIPIAQMISGPVGVIYIAVPLAFFQIMFFTHGEMIFGNNFSLKGIKKAVMSPCLLCAFVGLLVFFSRIQLPELFTYSISTVGGCATPLGMILAGGILGRSNMGPILRNPRTYVVIFVKLVLCPAVVLLGAKLMAVPQLVAISAIIAAGCPTASFCPIYAELYNKDSAFASGIFSLSTLLCMATLPAMVALYALI